LAMLGAGFGLAGSRGERDSFTASRADVVFFHMLLLGLSGNYFSGV
jgi:hypothetical protein